jgi:hypothetical protein
MKKLKALYELKLAVYKRLYIEADNKLFEAVTNREDVQSLNVKYLVRQSAKLLGNIEIIEEILEDIKLELI